MKVAIYNDCDTARYTHFGCELVMETIKYHLERCGHEYVGSVTKDNRRIVDVDALLGLADLVIVNGEGSYHHNRRNDLGKIGDRHNAILINSVYEKNSYEPSLKNYKYIACRESTSASELSRINNLKCDVIPDVIITNPRLLEQKITGSKHRVILHGHGSHITTKQKADSFFKEMSECSSISSISFHGLLVAMIMGHQIQSVLTSNTWKNEALMKDYLDDPNYIENGQKKIYDLFNKLHEFA